VTKKFTVCCLLYGDYPQLADRLLGSLARSEWYEWFDLRLGFNNCSESVHAVIEQIMYDWNIPIAYSSEGEDPYYKYPIMRELFWGPADIETPYTMWFDDDSWLLPQAPENWFLMVEQCLTGYDMAGAPYFWPHLTTRERQFIKDQPWYTGKPIPKAVKFITGGWWAARTEILRKHDWPIPELQHDGGDVMLGELCHQQGYTLGTFAEYVAINADDQGRCSKADRRGASGKTPRCGSNYQRPARHWTDKLME